MNILLTNDDGVFAEGIIKLAKALSRKHAVYISAPATQQSSVGRKLTLFESLKAEKVCVEGLPDTEAYAVYGTPVDSMRIGYEEFFRDKNIEMVVSGINLGANIGTDVFFSGTANAAHDASFYGIPALALSCCAREPIHMETSAELSLWAVDFLQKHPLPEGYYLNVNIPDIKKSAIKGVKMVPLCVQHYTNGFIREEAEDGRYVFKQNYRYITNTMNQDVDGRWIREGYVTVTPVQYDLTSYEYLNMLKKCCEEEKIWQD